MEPPGEEKGSAESATPCLIFSSKTFTKELIAASITGVKNLITTGFAFILAYSSELILKSGKPISPLPDYFTYSGKASSKYPSIENVLTTCSAQTIGQISALVNLVFGVWCWEISF